MASKSKGGPVVAEKNHNLTAESEPLLRERSRSRSPSKKKPNKGNKTVSKLGDYATNKDHDIFSLPNSDYSIMLVLTAIALCVRLFRIYQPSSVVFDEVHFGGFATKYIKGKFFMDVHPPLAKLLITLAGWLAGFDGSFDFKEIGKDYLEPGVPYVAMRMLPALMGVAVVPVMFLTLKASGCSTITATLGSGLVTFENGLVTQSRLILLDSPLIIFTALTALSWTSFMNQNSLGPSAWFGATWWFWLVSTGLSLGATVSCKWVGLFTIAWVGSITVLQLWVLLGDNKHVSVNTFVKHFLARALCLIGIPVAFYMFMFVIHFICLVNPGDGDGFMSAEFQSTLNSKKMGAVPADVALGSTVSIRHWNTQGGYLHSHASMYPGGSKQQQITLYPHKDENNMWLLENMTYPVGGTGLSGFENTIPPILIKDGDVIKLYHKPTHRRLHSHDLRPPVTEAEWQNEVSAYGYEGFEGDANDYFRVEIVKKMSDGPIAKTRLRTIQTKFRLIHVMTGCALFSHKVKLPKWGFEQQEVTCAKQGTLPNSIWFVEQNNHPHLADAEKVNYKNPGFLGKFFELQKVMWKTNAGLVESHAWDSRPGSWPILKRGINFWGRQNRQIYLIGNPFIWWSTTAAIAIYLLFKGIATLRWQRGYDDYVIENFRRFDFDVGASVLGWFFHYFPFFLMQRQLFLHHYFPALFFAIISLCQTWDFVFSRLKVFGFNSKPAVGLLAVTIYLAISIVVFYLYSPLAYGNMWTKRECKRVKLFNKWDWDCNNFLNEYADYANVPNKVTTGAKPSKAPQKGPAPPVAEKPAKKSEEKAAAKAAANSPAPNLNDAQKPLQGKVVKREERVEYRDGEGNIIREEDLAKLGSDVEFQTRYEVRTKLVDADGNFIGEEVGEGSPPPPIGNNPGAVEAETPEAAKEEEPKKETPEKAPVEEEKNPLSRNLEEPPAEKKKPEPEGDVEKETETETETKTKTTTIMNTVVGDVEEVVETVKVYVNEEGEEVDEMGFPIKKDGAK